MIKIYTICLLILCFSVKSQITQWEEIDHINFQHIEDANFFNEDLGIAVEDDKYHLTKDGGRNWKTVFSKDLYGRKCAIFASQGDTLFVIMSQDFNRVYYSKGFNHSLIELDSNSFCRWSGMGSITALNKGEVIYVTGCHRDSLFSSPTIFESKDLGRTWRRKTLLDKNYNTMLVDIEQRSNDTMVLWWRYVYNATQIPDYAEFRVDTFATPLSSASNVTNMLSVSCQRTQCIFNELMIHHGNNFNTIVKPHLNLDPGEIKVLKFFDEDEFITVPIVPVGSDISNIYTYHLNGDTIDRKVKYEIGPDNSSTLWKNICVTDYSVYLISSAKIFKRMRSTIGIEDPTLPAKGLEVFQGPGFAEVKGLEDNTIYSYEIYSLAGELIYAGILEADRNRIHLNRGTPAGIYLLNIESSTNQGEVFKIFH